MNIGLIGSGGREHALCETLFHSKNCKKIVCFPGNAGTSKIALNENINILDFRKLLELIKYHKIDLVVIGPEEPLVKGLVDFLNRNKVKVFGPDRYAAKLEGSKAFMKRLCKINNIPTANFKICKKFNQVKKFIDKNQFPIVVKADGLAAGKGVAICKSRKEVLKVTEEIFKGKFKSSKQVVLEEFLIGEEASYFLVVDKNNFKFFGTAQDHKRVKENDKGPNTGGMGAYSPAKIINKKLEKKILEKIVRPTLKFLKKKGHPYKGFLYVGLMIVKEEPFLIEYNVRMGDPECQVILPRLRTDLLKIITASIKNNLKNISIKWRQEQSMTIVLCSNGYPGDYVKNKKIVNTEKLKLRKNELIYHAGTKLENGEIYSNGGRVLNITCFGKKLYDVRKNILKIFKKINWKHGFFRKDIGWRVIGK